MRFALLLPVLAASLACAQDLGRIEGRVISTIGSPVGKADVLLMGPASPDRYLETTAADGSFAFDNVPAGRYVIRADKTGYLMAAAPAEITPAKTATLTMRMEPLAVVSGRVIDDDGDPVVNVRVWVLRPRWEMTGRVLDHSAAAMTNDQGEFRIANLLPGPYALMAEDPPARSGTASVEPRGPIPSQVLTPTYYPSGIDPRRAELVAAKSGLETRGLVIRMRRSQTYSISGTVRTAIGNQPLAAAVTAYLRGDENTPRSDSTAAGDGTGDGFSIANLPPGDYVLHSSATLPDGSFLSGDLEVHLTGDVEGAQLLLAPHSDIKGRVVLEDYGVLPFTAQRQGMIGARAVGEQFTGLSVNIVQDGAFFLSNLRPDRYGFNIGFARAQPGGPDAQAPGDFYVKALRVGGSEIANVPLDLTRGSLGPIEVVLSSRFGEIAIAQALDRHVMAWPKQIRAADADGGVTRLNANGTRLPPGEYFIAAFDDAPLGSYPFLAMFNDLAGKATVRADERVSVEAPLISRETVEGVLLQ